MTPLAVLERFVRKPGRAVRKDACELCAAPIEPVHRHVVDVQARRMQCACAACARVFDASGGRHRTVPTRVVRDSGDVPSSDWRALGVPVGLAFFLRPSTTGRWVGVFPSPAGATEAELPSEAWAAIEAKSALVRDVRDDVEAIVVRSRRDGRVECFLAPVDLCYEAVGAVRASWSGFDGGDEARAAVDAFMTKLSRIAEG